MYIWVLRRATVAAQGALSDQRHAAMKDLREAIVLLYYTCYNIT